MHKRIVVVFVPVVLALLTGCPSVSTTGMARTLNQGEMQGFVSPGFSSLSGVSLPQIEVGGRYGITDHIEFGAKAWLFGAGLDGKFSLLRSPSMQSGFDLSLDPSISYFGLGLATDGASGSIGLLTVQLPVMMGVNFSGHQLVLAPKLVGHVGSGGSDTVDSPIAVGQQVGVGATVGVAFKLGDNFRIMPELTYVQYVWSSAGTSGLQGAFIVQGGLNVLFGGRYESAAARSQPAGESIPLDDDAQRQDSSTTP